MVNNKTAYGNSALQFVLLNCMINIGSSESRPLAPVFPNLCQPSPFPPALGVLNFRHHRALPAHEVE